MFEDAQVVTWCIIICFAFFVSLFEGGKEVGRGSASGKLDHIGQ